MITITWHLFVLLLALLFSFCWALTRDGERGGLLGVSKRDCAVAVWAVVAAIIVLIYGGIAWW